MIQLFIDMAMHWKCLENRGWQDFITHTQTHTHIIIIDSIKNEKMILLHYIKKCNLTWNSVIWVWDWILKVFSISALICSSRHLQEQSAGHSGH